MWQPKLVTRCERINRNHYGEASMCVCDWLPTSFHTFICKRSIEKWWKCSRNVQKSLHVDVWQRDVSQFTFAFIQLPLNVLCFFFHFEKLFQFINDSNGFELIWNTLFDILSIQLLSISNTSLFFRSNCDKVINKMEQFQWCNWKFAYKKREFRRNKEFSKK